jgi:hypothetical protein
MEGGDRWADTPSSLAAHPTARLREVGEARAYWSDGVLGAVLGQGGIMPW